MTTQLEQLMNTDSIIESICNWNAARYEQEYNAELTEKLLLEELNELKFSVEKDTIIGTLDALGDIFYVTVGALWKQGYTPRGIETLLDHLEGSFYDGMPPSVAVLWHVSANKEYTLGFIALAVISKLEFLLGSSEEAFNVIRAICISNDTKEIQRVDSSVKANIDKGEHYTPPTKMLEEIIRRSFDEHEIS